jgi:hypothetical protein
MMPTVDTLSEINQSAIASNLWLPTADMASRVLRESAWRASHPSAGDWINDAARQAGYSTNAFRRQVRVADFLRSKVSSEEWQILLRRSIPFGNLELLQRLFDANADQAVKVLPKIINGELTFRAMRALYQKAQVEAGGGSGKKVVANRARQFMLQAIESIRKNHDEFIGAINTNTKITFQPALRGFPYARPDLLALGVTKDAANPARPLFADAFETKLFGMDDNRQVLVRTIEQASLLSSFFRQVWLVYPSSNPPIASHEQHVKELSIHLIALGMDSVGVALIPEENTITNFSLNSPEIRKLPVANSTPQRWALLASFLEKQA